MDAKITKKRLKEMLVYDWLKFIALGLAAVFFWMMLFTFTATKMTFTQQFTIFNHSTNGMVLNDLYDLLDDCLEDGFSYEVIEHQVIDLSDKADYASAHYDSYLSTEMAHLIFMPYAEETAQNFINQRFLNLISVNDFMTDMKAYVSLYYANGDYINGELNKAKVEEDFRILLKKQKDKRFRGAKFEIGLTAEYARIESYADAIVEFEGYIDSGLICYQAMEVQNSSHPEEVYVEKENYLVNLCPEADSAMKGLKKYLYRYDGTNNKKTALNMSVFFVKKGKYCEKAYSYESLLFLNKLISAAQAESGN